MHITIKNSVIEYLNYSMENELTKEYKQKLAESKISSSTKDEFNSNFLKSKNIEIPAKYDILDLLRNTKENVRYIEILNDIKLNNTLRYDIDKSREKFNYRDKIMDGYTSTHRYYFRSSRRVFSDYDSMLYVYLKLETSNLLIGEIPLQNPVLEINTINDCLIRMKSTVLGYESISTFSVEKSGSHYSIKVSNGINITLRINIFNFFDTFKSLRFAKDGFMIKIST